MIYVASRTKHAKMWKSLRHVGWPIRASWIDEAGESQTGEFWELWERIRSEIQQCSAMILFAEPDDFPLKGALVEAGMAIGFGKMVCVVLPRVKLEERSDRPIGSWIRHHSVKLCDSLEDAFDWIQFVSR